MGEQALVSSMNLEKHVKKYFSIFYWTISFQANHKVKKTNKKPRCGYYFRFLDEYLKKGFVL